MSIHGIVDPALLERAATAVTERTRWVDDFPTPGVRFADLTPVFADGPAFGAVIAASIFMASIVATVSPAATVSPSATSTVTAPWNGAATWPGWPGSAFSAAATSAATCWSRTGSGRSCPLMVAITVR